MRKNDKLSERVRSYEPLGIDLSKYEEIAEVSSATIVANDRCKVAPALCDWNFSVFAGFAIVANALRDMLMGFFNLGVDDLLCAKFIDLDQDYHLVGIGYAILVRTDRTVEPEEVILRYLDGICTIPLEFDRPSLPFDAEEKGPLSESVALFLTSYGDQKIKHPAWIRAGKSEVYLFGKYQTSQHKDSQSEIEVILVGEIDGLSRRKREFVIEDRNEKLHTATFDEAMFLKSLHNRLCDGSRYEFLLLRTTLPNGRTLDRIKEIGQRVAFPEGRLL